MLYSACWGNSFTRKRCRRKPGQDFENELQTVSRGGPSGRCGRGNRQRACSGWGSSRNRLGHGEIALQLPSQDMGSFMMHRVFERLSLQGNVGSNSDVIVLSKYATIVRRRTHWCPMTVAALAHERKILIFDLSLILSRWKLRCFGWSLRKKKLWWRLWLKP